MRTKIADISHYNHISDMSQVVQHVTGLLIKTSEKAAEDDTFREKYALCQAKNFPLALWHFYQPDTEPQVQVNKFLSIYHSLPKKHRIFLDCEEIDYIDKHGVHIQIFPTTKEEYTFWLMQWLSAVEQDVGFTPGVYTRGTFWEHWVLHSGAVFNYKGQSHTVPQWGRHDLWVANYDVPTPILPHGWANWRFWQWGSRLIPGFDSGSVDSDFFNGTEAEAIRYLTLSATNNVHPADLTKVSLAWPCDPGIEISQRFGENADLYAPKGLPGHDGLDFKTPELSVVFAMAAGVVAEVIPAGSTLDGGSIVLRHAFDTLVLKTHYLYLSAVGVKVGDPVTQGQILGLSGASSSPLEQHLHIAVTVEGAQTGSYPPGVVDPTHLLVRPVVTA